MANPIDDEDPTPRVSPGKRPGSAPARPAGRPAAGKGGQLPVVEPVEPHETRLAWGHVGSVTKPGRLSDGTSRPGVIRVVEANITYHTPPLDPYVWVQASLNLVGQYEMAWTEGGPTDVRSLADLTAELHRGVPSKPQLKLLDNVAGTLLATAQRLHSHDSRLGLLHAGNVLPVPGSEGRRLVLPDLGFIWRGGHGTFPWRDSPGRPRWLNEDPRENPNARLWDEDPVWQQFTCCDDSTAHRELVPVESDLKTLVRVFAAVLTGRVERDLPAAPNAAPVWGVLRGVMKGDIKTAEDFRARLAEHPLSEHWLAAKPLPQKSGASAMALAGILGVLGLLGLGAGAGLYLAGFFDSSASSTNNSNVQGPPSSKFQGAPVTVAASDAAKASASAALLAARSIPKRPYERVEVDWKNRPSTRPSELEQLLKQIEEAKDPREALDLLVKMYRMYETADDATRARIRPWIEYWRGMYVNSWEQRYKQADDSVIKNVALRFDVGQQIYDLHQELGGLRQKYEPISPSLNEREKECLLISDLRSRELGSPR